MGAGPFGFVLTIIALSMVAWIITTWIKAKHGYPLDDGAGGKIERTDSAEAKRLQAENAGLKDELAKLEDRTRVLERIVTDKGYSVADQIEALRDTPGIDNAGNGVPLNIDKKERAQ